MKIMHLVSGCDLDDTGKWILKMLRELSGKQQVTLVCFEEGALPKAARQAGIRTRVIRGNPFSLRKKLLTGLTQNRYGLLHCHGSRADFYGSWLRKDLKIPVVSTVFADPWEGSFRDRYAAKHRDGLVTVSDQMREKLLDRGLDEDRVWPVYDGIDFSSGIRYTPRQEYLKNLGMDWNDDHVIFGVRTGLSSEENISGVIRVFSETVGQVANARLLIAGDGTERDKLETLASEICPSGTVCFAGDQPDADSFFRCVDVNVVCTGDGEFLATVLEGARMYCPAIAAPVGCAPSLVKNRETGFLVDAGDWQKLSESMACLAQDAPLRHQMGWTIHQRASEQFSVEAMAARLMKCYTWLWCREAEM